MKGICQELIQDVEKVIDRLEHDEIPASDLEISIEVLVGIDIAQAAAGLKNEARDWQFDDVEVARKKGKQS
jgi:hypothetical protein